jgi:two-component system response regulator AtoC
MVTALVVEDDRSIRLTLEKLLRSQGYDVTTATNGRDAVEAIRTSGADVVLLDLGLPQMDGLEVLSMTQAMHDAPPIIVTTAREDMQCIIRAVQLGTYDYLVKPLDVDRLKLVVRRAIEARQASRTLQEFVSRAAQDFQVGNIVGRSPLLLEVYKAIGSVSVSRTSVLIQGESGTGKELVARAIHYASADCDKPFVAVNCTALSRDLLESELFGHVKGAFTGAINTKLGRFELAGNGTLFLDEIAEVPLDLQAKLLRVLQERTFERVGENRSITLNARVIAATHRNLGQMVQAGLFREDLYYRLKVVEIHLPPLRQRMEDLPLLVESLLRKINLDVHKQVTQVSPEALQLLSSYHWPGNVRELENALTRAVVLSTSSVLEARLLPIADASTSTAGQPAEMGARSSSRTSAPPVAILPLREIEKQHIGAVLAHTGWNKRRACALLEISRPTLDRKIEEYALTREGGGSE